MSTDYIGIPVGNIKNVYCPRRKYKIPENLCSQCITKECKIKVNKKRG